MDQTEVLHLLESPDALKVKVTGMTLMVPRGRMYHGPARNKADANMAAGGGSGMLPVPYEMAGVGGMLPHDAAAPIHNKCLLQRWLPLLLTTILDGRGDYVVTQWYHALELCGSFFL
ncbi:hypothetical protein HanRHA438_Chr14g0635361 [Helianthus annuus]|uniref:Uncharacterized protein n=1 Tax=Helianthus annuus TaxID=4232 RepID=A0A9K3E5U1_HELAN|nr:hypothetical protein HanXRQr2_Chr14g0625341 [Helianthus annuus]KAJ0484426.1 hypothetical protein HanHA89_Chr14g0543951 [Helianthus annuus]KAJ0654979.1 hypothetical protein HanLR1_Chr14g0513221 [Helianthus annuus]KAJ0838896.1 hypothetical protein HanPSC8_Chr14g0600151 [Helianthus annuus]KAJ0852197.1 hypothetical protein HanRHA438_Chr14g0635361 [Helianthus annuus]